VSVAVEQGNAPAAEGPFREQIEELVARVREGARIIEKSKERL